MHHNYLKIIFGLLITTSSITSLKLLAASFISSQCDATLTFSFMQFFEPFSFKYLTLNSTDSAFPDMTTCFSELILEMKSCLIQMKFETTLSIKSISVFKIAYINPDGDFSIKDPRL